MSYDDLIAEARSFVGPDAASAAEALIVRLADALEAAANVKSALVCDAIAGAQKMPEKRALLFAPTAEVARRAWVYLIDGDSERARELLHGLMDALGIDDRSRSWKGSAAIDAARKEKP